ncbi:hypothetical protein ACFYNF_34500 [Streptomyces sp. NPDC006641]|uniref:hypothetical protein n=1 Tax=unclassified Streptomyces TaxID=2593676 RepID=UPI0036766423
MTEALEPAVTLLLAEAEQCKLTAVLADTETSLAEQRRQLTAIDRIEGALPELERLEGLYPGRSSTRELLTDAGVACTALGLEDGDPELIDQWLAENGTGRA